jgi:hypothetical protein
VYIVPTTRSIFRQSAEQFSASWFASVGLWQWRDAIFPLAATGQGVIVPRVYFDNLDSSVTRDDLREFFSRAGEVAGVLLVTDSQGRSRGFGCVDMARIDDASYAIKWLKRGEIKGSKIHIHPALPRS